MASFGSGVLQTANLADSAVTSAKIADGTIVNADISASAAIATSKLETAGKASIDATAGANISAYAGVMLGDASNTSLLSQTASNLTQSLGASVDYQSLGQKITTHTINGYVTHINLKLSKTGSPSDNIVVTIRTTNETGTVLCTAIKAGSSLTTTPTVYTLAFDVPARLDSGTSYYIVVARSGSVNASNYFGVDYQGTDVLANSNMRYFDSVIWNDATFWDMYFVLIRNLTSGYAYPSDTKYSADSALAVGIAPSAISAAGSGTVQISGQIINAGWSWTPGKLVYATDTAGTLSHTAGSNSRVIGRALTSTSIFISTVS